MTTMTTAAAPRSLQPLTVIAPVLLAGFGAFSLWVAGTQGVFGFLTLAGREPWALQLLLDLAISVSFAIGWMAHDARRRGIAMWPYAVASICVGSLGILAYCVRRSFTPPRGT